MFGGLSHPHRLRIVAELRGRELDVNSLQALLGISHSGVSQNLAVLRAHQIVRERREGRRVIYSLADPAMGDWILEGLRFIESGAQRSEQVRGAVETARAIWSGQSKHS